MQRKSSNHTYFKAIYCNPEGKTYFTEEKLDLENVWVTGKGSYKQIEYAYKVGDIYQLAVRRANTFAFDGIRIENLNMLKKSKGYQFKVVGDKVVFDNPFLQFEPINLARKRKHKDIHSSQMIRNENSNKAQDVWNFVPQFQEEQEEVQLNISEVQLDISKNPPSSPPQKHTRNENNIEQKTPLSNDLFYLITFNGQLTATRGILLGDEIRNIKQTKVIGRKQEYCLPINGELQLVVRKSLVNKLTGKTLNELQQLRKDKPYIYETSGDKIIFCKKNGRQPELVSIDDDFLERAMVAAEYKKNERGRTPILFSPINIPKIAPRVYQPAPITPTLDNVLGEPIDGDEAILEKQKSPSNYHCGFFHPENNIRENYTDVSTHTNNINERNTIQNTVDDDEFLDNLLKM